MDISGNPVACVLLSVLAVLQIAGCGQPKAEIPTTWPIKGKVLNGGQPIAGGTIEFQPTGEGRRAVGEIGPDGSFSVFTFFDNDKTDGALPGSYRVTVIPPIPPDQNVQIYNLAKSYQIEAKDNEFMIDVSKK
jgi:hypothetical protein